MSLKTSIMTNTFQTMYEDQPVEIKYRYEGEEVEDAWIHTDIKVFNISKVYLLACEHHKQVLLADPSSKLKKT